MTAVTLAELDAALNPAQLALCSEMAAVAPDPVRWVEFMEEENLRLSEELFATRQRVRAIMTACFTG